MNKEEMVTALSQRAGFTRRDAETALNCVLGIISDELVSGGKVYIVGFGTFEVRDRAPRTGRNPKAGIPVKIPACRAPSFRAHKTLKESVNCANKPVKTR